MAILIAKNVLETAADIKRERDMLLKAVLDIANCDIEKMERYVNRVDSTACEVLARIESDRRP